MKILILGAGLVGRPMALDLAETSHFKITLCDNDISRLEKVSNHSGITPLLLNVRDREQFSKICQQHDLIVNALPGFLGYEITKQIIEFGKDLVDISFFPEDPEPLEELAEKNKVTAIIDCGIAPGMSYILAGFAYYQLNETKKIRIYVGGLPVVREYPFEYKAVFSPVDVIEEYTRPARYMKDGKIVVMPPLSESELINFPGIGTLEAFNTDGLRSMLKNIRCPDMQEKTLRYPGHIAKIQFLKDCGFFNTTPIKLHDCWISPLEFTSAILFPLWKLNENEQDITVMRVLVEGIREEGNQKNLVTYQWDLFDTYNEKTGIHSMARTTGYTATAAVRMLNSGIFKETGLIYPEKIGKYPECVTFILNELRQRGINYHEKLSRKNFENDTEQ